MNKDKFAHISDAELLDKYSKDKRKEWLGILLNRYTLLLLGTCMKYLKNQEEAKDAVQQVFLKALTELPKYKVEYFRSWIYIIARNHCLKKLQEKNVHTNLKEDMALEEHFVDLTELAKKENSLQILQEAIQQLNPEQKICINLFYNDKRSYAEISKKTGFNLLQVKSHIQNGKRNLKIFMEKNGGI